jgi:hypothetical protein
MGPGMDLNNLSEKMNFLLDISLEPRGTLIIDQLSWSMIGDWNHLTEGWVYLLFIPTIVALLFLLCWCMTQVNKPMANMHAYAWGYMFFTTFSLSIMVSLPFKIGNGDMLATWV